VSPEVCALSRPRWRWVLQETDTPLPVFLFSDSNDRNYILFQIHKSPTPGVCKSQIPGQQATELCNEAINIYSAIIAVFSVHTKSIYQSTSTKQKTSDKNEVHRPLQQHCGSSARKLLLVTLPAPIIWRKLLDFCKICVHLIYTEICCSLHHKIIFCNQNV